MTFIVQPSKNKMLDAAWKGFRKEQRSEKKSPKEEAADVHTKPAKPEQVSPDVHKKRASKQVVAKKPAKARRK